MGDLLGKKEEEQFSALLQAFINEQAERFCMTPEKVLLYIQSFSLQHIYDTGYDDGEEDGKGKERRPDL